IGSAAPSVSGTVLPMEPSGTSTTGTPPGRGRSTGLRRCSGLSSAPFRVDHAEEVALRISEDDEVLGWLWGSGMAGRPEPHQPLHLTLLVGGVEVEVQPVLAHPLLRHL